ncbi:MAG: 50S ribosomal protein L21 [Clostridia bacterium]|nr:50S ribosomal protein L21 [Clostridia bacterium]
MYAIIATGGKQYTVEENQVLNVEKIDAEIGASVNFSVLMINDGGNVLVGNDVAGAHVEATVLAAGKDKKVIVYKYKAKKNERRRQGHRQPFTTVKITSIVK